MKLEKNLTIKSYEKVSPKSGGFDVAKKLILFCLVVAILISYIVWVNYGRTASIVVFMVITVFLYSKRTSFKSLVNEVRYVFKNENSSDITLNDCIGYFTYTALSVSTVATSSQLFAQGVILKFKNKPSLIVQTRSSFGNSYEGDLSELLDTLKSGNVPNYNNLNPEEYPVIRGSDSNRAKQVEKVFREKIVDSNPYQY